MDKCSETQMDFGQVLCLTEQPTSEVYFPLSGFISQVAGLDNQKPLEVGMIGSEGMLVAPLVLGIKTAPFNSIVQGQGVALTIPVNTFILMVMQYSLLANLLPHYVFMQLIQLKQASLCQCALSCSSFGTLAVNESRSFPATRFSTNPANYGRYARSEAQRHYSCGRTIKKRWGDSQHYSL
jgi:hypothetical protein